MFYFWGEATKSLKSGEIYTNRTFQFRHISCTQLPHVVSGYLIDLCSSMVGTRPWKLLVSHT